MWLTDNEQIYPLVHLAFNRGRQQCRVSFSLFKAIQPSIVVLSLVKLLRKIWKQPPTRIAQDDEHQWEFSASWGPLISVIEQKQRRMTLTVTSKAPGPRRWWWEEEGSGGWLKKGQVTFLRAQKLEKCYSLQLGQCWTFIAYRLTQSTNAEKLNIFVLVQAAVISK